MWTKFMKHIEYSNVSIVRSSGCTAVVGYLPCGLDSSLGESAKKLSHAKRHIHKHICVTHCCCFCICCVLSSVDRASLYNLVNKANLVHNLFISFLYMSQATVCPSSGETTVFLRHLALVILCGWLSGMHTSQPHRVTNTKCCINTVVSPDDGHTVARNTERKEINILRKTVHQVGLIYKIICYVLMFCITKQVIWQLIRCSKPYTYFSVSFSQISQNHRQNVEEKKIYFGALVSSICCNTNWVIQRNLWLEGDEFTQISLTLTWVLLASSENHSTNELPYETSPWASFHGFPASAVMSVARSSWCLTRTLYHFLKYSDRSWLIWDRILQMKLHATRGGQHHYMKMEILVFYWPIHWKN